MKIVLAYVLCLLGGVILGSAGVAAGIGTRAPTVLSFFGAILAAIVIIVGCAIGVMLNDELAI